MPTNIEPYNLENIVHIRGLDHPESIGIGPDGQAARFLDRNLEMIDRCRLGQAVVVLLPKVGIAHLKLVRHPTGCQEQTFLQRLRAQTAAWNASFS